MSDFSVVISVYKKDNHFFLKESLESLLNQSVLPSEIVLVVDGYVNEHINKVIEFYSSRPLFKIIRLKENKGLANALNIGIINSSFDVIARMDADDICFETRFEIQLEYMKKNNLSIVGGQIIEFGNCKEDIISQRNVPVLHQDLKKFMKYRSPFSHPTIMFHKKVFESLGGYDINIFPEDYDFFVRAYLKDFKFGNVKENVLWFRMGRDITKTLKRRWGINYAKNELKLYWKFYKIGFFSFLHFLKISFLKIPLRLIPFFIFKLIYLKIYRN